jgi:hypothetical protein
MEINITDQKKGKGGSIDFGNNQLDFNLALRNAVQHGDEEQVEDLFLKYYLLGSAVDTNRWMQMKNENKPLVMQDPNSTSTQTPFTDAPEKMGMLPAKMLTEHLKELRNIPEDQDDEWMMGMEPTYHSSKEELEADPKYALGPKGTRTAANERKFKEALGMAGQRKGSQFRDLNDDEIEHYGQMLEDIMEQNEANKTIPNFPEVPFGKPAKTGKQKGVQRTYRRRGGVNVDFNPQVGNKTFEKGEMRDYMKGLSNVEKAIRMVEKDPSKMKEAQKLVEPYFGADYNVKGAEKGGKSRFAQHTRNALSRISTARGLQNLYNDGNLQRVMSQAIMQGAKVSFDPEKPGFPFLKLGAESDLDPETFGLRGEEVELEFYLML